MMSELLVLRPGFLTTVQDRGRYGRRGEGVAVCGAADSLAFAVGNRMLCNPPDAAALEITLGGAVMQFTAPVSFALTGADTEATLDDEPIAPWSRYTARAGQTLRCGAVRRGVRTMLAVNGGIDVPPVLGSRSTDLAGGFGGFEGRALRSGDRLRIAGAPSGATAQRVRIKPPQWHFDERTIRVLPATEYEAFSAAARDAFWTTGWLITPQSNRMGYRLDGAVLDYAGAGGTMLSHAVFPGVIQVPPSGGPIVLMTDAQTTGGYPKIGTVIGADLWKLSQIPIGASVRFAESTLGEAQAARRALQQYERGIDAAIASAAHG